MNKITNIFLGSFILLVNVLFSQDIIIKKNNEQIRAKILEVGTTEIKFKFYDAQDGPTITISKSDVKSLKIKGKNESSVIDVNDDPMSVSNNLIMDKTNSLKFHFFSPLNSHLAFGYEWMKKPGFNWEVGMGIIGLGTKTISDNIDLIENSKPAGAFIRGGAKFLLGSTSDYEVEGLKYAHPLKGRYFKVEAIINVMSKRYSIDTTSWAYLVSHNFQSNGKIDVKNSYQSLTLNLIYGRQFIFGNSLTAGYFVGIGYSLENFRSNLLSTSEYYGWDTARYSHWYGGKEFPMTLTGGLTIGYILKTPEWFRKKAGYRNVAPSRNSMK